MISILENHVSLQALAFLSVIINSRRSDTGFAIFHRDLLTKNFINSANLNLRFEQKANIKNSKISFRKNRLARVSILCLSHTILSFPLILSFIRLSLFLVLTISHSLFLPLHSRIL